MDRDEYVYDELLKLQTELADLKEEYRLLCLYHSGTVNELISLMNRVKRLEDEQTRLT